MLTQLISNMYTVKTLKILQVLLLNLLVLLCEIFENLRSPKILANLVSESLQYFKFIGVIVVVNAVFSDIPNYKNITFLCCKLIVDYVRHTKKNFRSKLRIFAVSNKPTTTTKQTTLTRVIHL